MAKHPFHENGNGGVAERAVWKVGHVQAGIKLRRIEIAVNDEFVDETIKAIVKAAKSGNIGDGKIFVMPMDECIRIRTDETGPDAIG